MSSYLSYGGKFHDKYKIKNNAKITPKRNFHVYVYSILVLQEMLEKALQGILRQQDMSRDNPRDLDKLLHQQRTLEKELSRVMYQLAEASKV